MSRSHSALLVVLALCLSPGVGQQPATHTPSSDRQQAHTGYVGDPACLSCHKDQSLPYLHTAHHLTSQPGTRDAILGSFQPGANVLMIADPATAEQSPGLYFKMEETSGSFFQTAVTGWPELLQQRRERIDLVIGSGVRGQSYLFWRGDHLYELPVSFWSEGHRWINSPGYPNGTADFSRPVDPRCMECHASYIQPRAPSDLAANAYDPQSLVTGIGCETCHGPGLEHVTLHQAAAPRQAPASQAILNPAHFTRDRQVELCALCHNGIRQKEVQPAFSYRPGQPLDNYLRPDLADLTAQPNVHGDQVGLLKKSRCYLSSPTMSCSTCHNVHAPEQAAASYSARCLTCHRVEACGIEKSLGPGIAGNCIDCHMPVQPTTAIVSDTAGQLIRPTMRTHWIKVYR